MEVGREGTFAWLYKSSPLIQLDLLVLLSPTLNYKKDKQEPGGGTHL